MTASPTVSTAKVPGKYVAGDFHNHTTCSDGSISMQKLVKKSTDTQDTPWGLDWFVQAGHGGNGNRNCTLVEDAALGTPAYPYVANQGPTTTWVNSGVAIKGDVSGAGANRNMWRWQSVQEFQYPLIEYLNAYLDLPLFLGVETVVPGHEHTSMSIITDQMPDVMDEIPLPNGPGYVVAGSATSLAQWEYCFDRADGDTSRGAGNQWDCSVPGSLNANDASWNANAHKLVPAGGAGTGLRGHGKTLEALKWMAQYHPMASYYVPAHLERAGVFNPDGNNGFNVEHLRDFNNVAPKIAFGFETQPGHGASDGRGEYFRNRNNFGGGNLVDSAGGTTFGGTGVYGAIVGGVWDALLGEGRAWWFFASSDWHNRGLFGPDDRRSSQDFLPGEYQRNYTLVRSEEDDNDGCHGRHEHGHDHGHHNHHADKLRPQNIVDGLRSGNVFTTSGQLIDRLAFVACVGNPGRHGRNEQDVAEMVAKAAADGTTIDEQGCATMGEKLEVRSGTDVVIGIAVRDPEGANYSPYTFNNPSLAQVGIQQPINTPELDHVDLIGGLVSGFKTPGAPDYAGEWPRNAAWMNADGTTNGLGPVPAAAKNTSAAVLKSWSDGKKGWKVHKRGKNGTFYVMTYRLEDVKRSQYARLRGTNMPVAVPYETDANGNPLADLYTNAVDKSNLRIPCTIAHSANSQFDGCPDHMATASAGPIAGQKAVSYDVAAWSDLWFYSNPIYVEVDRGVVVAGLE